MALSTAPVWIGTGLEPRPVVLGPTWPPRATRYAVMPGGLTRVASARDVPIVSMQRGGGSKDTWVLSDGPVSTCRCWRRRASPMRPERRAADLPSRVADNLFWLGRYAERAEHTCGCCAASSRA